MKKANAFLFVAICSLSSALAQNLNTDLSKLNLNGKVKITKVRFYDAISGDGGFTKGKANAGDSNNYENIDTEFNETGNIKTVARLRFQDESIVEKDYYTYENNKLVEINTNDSKGNPSKKRTFEYDQQGKKLKDIFLIRLDGKPLITSYEYNKMDQIERIVDYGGTTTDYKYDKSGKLVEIKKKNEGNTWLDSYSYNDKGKLVKIDKYTNKKLYETLNYDENGKLISPKSSFVSEEFDSHQNWVKRVKFNHGIYFYIERTIVYSE